jgi:DNA-binding beta-propeller fold protein YncE
MCVLIKKYAGVVLSSSKRLGFLIVGLAGFLLAGGGAQAQITYLKSWGTLGSRDYQFNSPSGISVDASGNVFVADTGNDRIQKFDSQGNFLWKFGSLGSGNTQFDSPLGVAVGSSSLIYVADMNNNLIKVFNGTGNFVQSIGAGQLSHPEGVAVNQGDYDVYVADTGHSRILDFFSGGSITFGTDGTGNGQFHFPMDVTIAPNGNLYVADNNNNRVQYFSST